MGGLTGLFRREDARSLLPLIVSSAEADSGACLYGRYLALTRWAKSCFAASRLLQNGSSGCSKASGRFFAAAPRALGACLKVASRRRG